LPYENQMEFLILRYYSRFYVIGKV